MNNLQARINANSANVNATINPKVKLIKKDNANMNKEIAVKTNIPIYENFNDTIGMIRLYSDRIKPIKLGQASDNIRKALNDDFYFDNIFNAKDMNYLSDCFDNLIKESLMKAKGTKTIDIDIESLEQAFMTDEQIQAYKDNYTNKEYSFSELKADIDKAFDLKVKAVIITLFSLI
jgi:hypothetical protein